MSERIALDGGRVRRVAHLIAPAAAGGAESVVLALASAARERSTVIVLNQVASGDEASHPFTAQLQKRHISGHELRCGRRRYVAEVRAVAALLEREQIDLLHTHGYHATIVGFFAARRARLPVVATVHGYLSRNLKERFYNLVDRFVLRRFDAVIAVSQGIARQLLTSGLRDDRVTIVQNGLGSPAAGVGRSQARTLIGASEADSVVGWVGRLSREKGADLFLEAMRRTPGHVRAVIVGDGAELPALTRQARDLGVADRVTFAGFRPDAAELLEAFDVLALSSRIEGTPMIILESVAAGVPIVAFSIGGIPDLLRSETAWLVPPQDVGGFADALTAALAAPEQRRERAAAARAALEERLSADRWLARVQSVYERAAARGE